MARPTGPTYRLAEGPDVAASPPGGDPKHAALPAAQKPMNRILQTLRPVDSRQTGGVEELLLMFCPALRRHGRFDTSIFLLRKPNPEADPARDFGGRARALGIHVLSLAQVRWSYPWLGAVPRGLDISIVHMHGQRANYAIWLL